MIQKNLIIISGTEPRILCSEVIRKNNSSMTHLTSNDYSEMAIWQKAKLSKAIEANID